MTAISSDPAARASEPGAHYAAVLAANGFFARWLVHSGAATASPQGVRDKLGFVRAFAAELERLADQRQAVSLRDQARQLGSWAKLARVLGVASATMRGQCERAGVSTNLDQ